ncbi:hypothetical protein ACYJ1Y_15880 [Natrialbaceae archaeon A-gly3]
MKDPEKFDDDDWLDSLGKGDRERFNSLFDEKYRAIDENRAETSFKRRFEDQFEQEHRLFKAIVDSFAPKNSADGSDSGFETTIINPLYERCEHSADILLARKQVRNVHLCFVSCEIAGEKSDTWRERVNDTYEVFQSETNREKLKTYLECSGLNFRTVQYLTVTRGRDLIDVDMDVMRLGTTPDNYAIWKLMESELPDDDDEDEEITHHSGHVEHPDLHDVSIEGLDYTLADYDDVKFSLNTHPIFPIGEVCLQVYLDQYGSVDHPDEFNKGDFERSFKSKIEVGEDRNELEHPLQTKIENLLQIAVDADMIQDSGDEFDTSRDYRLRWDSDDPKDIKSMVKRKYFKLVAPKERGRLAYIRARDEFEGVESSLDDYFEDIL